MLLFPDAQHCTPTERPHYKRRCYKHLVPPEPKKTAPLYFLVMRDHSQPFLLSKSFMNETSTSTPSRGNAL